METNKIPGSRAHSGIPGQPFNGRSVVGECFTNWTKKTFVFQSLIKGGKNEKSSPGEAKNAVRKKATSRNAGSGVRRTGETRQETRGFYGNRKTLVKIPPSEYVSDKSCFVFNGLVRKSALAGYGARHHDQIPRIGVHRGRYAQDLPPAFRPGKSVFQGIGGIHLEVQSGGLAREIQMERVEFSAPHFAAVLPSAEIGDQRVRGHAPEVIGYLFPLAFPLCQRPRNLLLEVDFH